MNIKLREGKPDDIPAVLDLIRELAEYERAAGEVTVTTEQMTEWGFGAGRVFHFFVLEKDGRIVGLALYYYKYSTWKGRCLFLEDLIVTAAERRKGYGAMLFNAVRDVAKKEKVQRMEWQVLEWNGAAIEFYRRYRAVLDAEWINCKLTYDQLQSP